MTVAMSNFSIVIPTYRRSELLSRVLPSYLATGADEVVLVDDGSGPGHRLSLERLANEPNVRLVALNRHVGLPAARNEGAAAVEGPWVVFGEDDAWFTPEYPRTLIEHAERAGALAAAGCSPLVHPDLLDGPLPALEAAIRARAADNPGPSSVAGVPWTPDVLTDGDLLTPFLSARAAVHRSVFDRVRFDPRYTGNAFREETDFFLRAFEVRFRTVHCPHAACGHLKEHTRSVPGGSWHMSRSRYAWQMAWNNWRLLRAHDDLVRRARRRSGRRGGAVAAQAEFLASMLRRVRPERAEPASLES
jgi:GT2 family glycosyltransferase